MFPQLETFNDDGENGGNLDKYLVGGVNSKVSIVIT